MVSDRGRAFYYGRMRRLFLGVLLVVLLYAGWTAAGLPSRAEVRALARTNPTVTSLMRQREAEARRAGRPFRRVQSWVPISSVSRHLIHAVIASEDQRFFGHEGVDWDAIKKSVDADRAQGRFVRGGSTITQQLAKNLFFTTEKSITRKVRELVAARWLEGDLSKKRILELYLNVIEWGDGVYGAEAAAQHYYGKPASALGPEEAAGLAGMIPNPRRINPLVDARRFARAERRALWLMASAGYSLGSALTFVLVLNFGAMIGAIGGGWLADRFHIKYVLIGMYSLAAVSITLLGYKVSTEMLFLLVGLAGASTIGTQIVTYAYAGQFYPMAVRSTGIGWASGVGRSGAILAPIVIGTLVGMALPLQQNFLAIAIPAVIATIAVSLINHSRAESAHHEDVSAILPDPMPGGAKVAMGSK